MKELEGLKYTELSLDDNVHRITGKLNKFQNGQEGEVEIDKDGVWLITGLGLLKKDTPEELIRQSVEDIIIISKKDLIEFLDKKTLL